MKNRAFVASMHPQPAGLLTSDAVRRGVGHLGNLRVLVAKSVEKRLTPPIASCRPRIAQAGQATPIIKTDTG